jgi:GDP-L-fucose synthase
MDKISNGSAINLSTGIYTSFIEFAKLAANTIGYNPIISGNCDMPSGVFARAGDTTLQSTLGFSCNINFKSGIERALKYYSKII